MQARCCASLTRFSSVQRLHGASQGTLWLIGCANVKHEPHAPSRHTPLISSFRVPFSAYSFGRSRLETVSDSPPTKSIVVPYAPFCLS